MFLGVSIMAALVITLRTDAHTSGGLIALAVLLIVIGGPLMIQALYLASVAGYRVALAFLFRALNVMLDKFVDAIIMVLVLTLVFDLPLMAAIVRVVAKWFP